MKDKRESFSAQPPFSVYFGTAGWSLPKAHAAQFAGTGSHLERYARRLNAVEINSSFYRHHRASTYERWSSSVPPEFRFALKLFRGFTHVQRLEVDEAELRETLTAPGALGAKLGVLLVQIPPSLEFARERSTRFFTILRRTFSGPVALEPRHATWASIEACDLLRDFAIAKVRADPDRCPISDASLLSPEPFAYYRLHGSPMIYRSTYSDEDLNRLAHEITGLNGTKTIWCFFDNTAEGHATKNALRLSDGYQPAFSSAPQR